MSEFEKLLAYGYQLMGELNLQICNEFLHIEINYEN